ncbi:MULTISPECIES: GNAT family N-acetyltransferase [unclassified Streptomyces]|uniref:GNAT family N-acetyltransferase n=1 Tax=unclassified Streptomyces TaxID=2593676 RepID=UPI002252845C|nr:MULTISPECIES: GNAT family N-acetyltransferase [unclassified Streptomyces]MCX4987995.1 acetyltransferase [Streptomyces sp. NBC_00568]MCX5006873.1 acetyltransferase [Streptomyces sp. NBC_00638]
MPPTDASTDASTDAGTARATRPDPGAAPGPVSLADPGSDPGAGTDSEDTLDLRLPDELIALFAGDSGDGGDNEARDGTAGGDDLLDRVGGWGPTATPAGVFHLVPARTERDLPLITRWMNDPAVAAFWELAGSESVVEEHLRRQIDGDGRSVPCLGTLDGTPMSYWEIYRADLDPLARHYPARPHDTGIHLLIGGVADRGHGLGSTLLRAVADHVLEKRPSCARVVAEPDLRNTPSVSAFLSAGFRFSAEVDLPDKRAALMIRDRALRDLS